MHVDDTFQTTNQQSTMNIATEQELRPIYGSQRSGGGDKYDDIYAKYFKAISSGGNTNATTVNVNTNNVGGRPGDKYDEIYARFSQAMTGVPSVDNNNVSVVERANSVGELEGVETVSFEGTIAGAGDMYGRTNTTNLDNAAISPSRMFTSTSEYGTTLKDPSGSFSIKDNGTDYEQQLLLSTTKFEESLQNFNPDGSRVSMDPPEYYAMPQAKKVSTLLYSSSPREYTLPSVASRDDVGSVKPGTSNSSRDVGLSSISSFSSNCTATNRGDVQSKLQELNAKSKAFKEFLEKNTVSPMAMGQSLPRSHRTSGSTAVEKKYRYDDIDARLEVLQKQCLALKQQTALSGQSSSGVAFSSSSNTKNDADQRSIHQEPILKAPSSGGDKSTTQTPSTPVDGFATKILSEKILNGYHMTREHCNRCNVSLLSHHEKLTDGEVVEKRECVICPMNNLRSLIQGGIAKKVMASKVFQGESTLSGGALCKHCISPTLVQKDGTVVCEVCPVLDQVCIEIVKEQSRGSKLQDAIPCLKCGSKQMMNVRDELSCVVCAVTKEWEQQQKAASSSDVQTKERVKSGVEDTPTNGNSKSPAKKGPKLFETLMGQCGATPPSLTKNTSLGNLQSQLKGELEKAKKCQALLEKSIENPHLLAANYHSPEEMKEELAKAKRCQYALERIIQTTSNIGTFPDTGANEIDDMVSAPEVKNEGSFSISQQEVEAGQPKEYIPPPSYFRCGIPSMVEITLISPDDSVAPSYHTKHLKDSDKKYMSKSRVGMNLCGCSHDANSRHREEPEDGGFDHNTIQTDDFTLDYTLNTNDESRLEYLHIKSKNPRVRFEIDEEEDSPAPGCWLLQCFGCGDGSMSEGRQDASVYRRHESRGRRESPMPSHSIPPDDDESEYSSVLRTPKKILRNRNARPTQQAPPRRNSRPPSTPKVAPPSDYSVISNVSESMYQRQMRQMNAPCDQSSAISSVSGSNFQFNDPRQLQTAPPKRTGSSDYSAISDISGSMMYRTNEQPSWKAPNAAISKAKANARSDYSAVSELSGSGILRNPYPDSRRRVWNQNGSSRPTMGVLLEEESFDTSDNKDKYAAQLGMRLSQAESALSDHKREINGFVKRLERQHAVVRM